MTLKEIRNHQLSEFNNMKDSELVEAYGTVNVFKKEFADLEKDLKGAILKRKETGTGFDKSVQMSLSFPTGDVSYSVAPNEKKVYSLIISPEDFYKVLADNGINPATYMKVEYKITASALEKLRNNSSISPVIRANIVVITQSTLDFKTKKEDK